MSTLVLVDQLSSENEGKENSQQQLQPQPPSVDEGEENPQQELQPQPQSVGSRSYFLDLPLEIRFNIYRHLLLADGPIQDVPIGPGPRLGLYTGVMATCSQIRSECQVVLYGENVVRMTVYNFIETFTCYFRESCEHQHGMDPLRHKRLQQTKSFEIVYEGLCESEELSRAESDRLIHDSHVACRMMSRLENLRFVSLNLAAVNAEYGRVVILKAWSLLRNVGRVVVNLGGLPVSKSVVKEFTENATKKVPLLRAYYALERYGKPPYSCKCLLSDARWLAEKNDLEKFKSTRAKIIAEIDKTMEKAKEGFMEYDP